MYILPFLLDDGYRKMEITFFFNFRKNWHNILLIVDFHTFLCFPFCRLIVNNNTNTTLQNFIVINFTNFTYRMVRIYHFIFVLHYVHFLNISNAYSFIQILLSFNCFNNLKLSVPAFSSFYYPAEWVDLIIRRNLLREGLW